MFVSTTDEQGISADDFFTGQGSPAAVHRLLAGRIVSEKIRKYQIHRHMCI